MQACEAIAELGTNGALRELREQLRDHLKSGSFPGWFDRWLDAEATAKALRTFELVAVPGLLQTEAYARAMPGTQLMATADEIEEMVAARLARQAILGRDRPPTFWVILDEGVLRRPVGGPKVMPEQLQHLADAARRPNIVLQIIPRRPVPTRAERRLRHRGLRDGPAVGYVDTASRGQIIEDADDIRALAPRGIRSKRRRCPGALP